MDEVLKNGIAKVISSYREATGQKCYYYDLASISDGMKIAENAGSFCRLVHQTQQGCAGCMSTLMSTVIAAVRDAHWKVNICRSGILEWVTPVFYEGNAVGIFLAGHTCNSEESKKALIDQSDVLAAQYGVSKEAVESACSEVSVIGKTEARYHARLLFDLCQLMIPSGRENPIDTVKNYRKQSMSFLENPEDGGEKLPEGQPLSKFIYSPAFTQDALTSFWHRIENKAEIVFANILAKRVAVAYQAFSEILSLAYEEETLELARSSAETLFRIVILSQYSDDGYDLRFYRLAYEILRKSYRAKSFEELHQVMEEAFNTMCSFFVADPLTAQQDPLVVSVMEYIEKNYQKNIKVEDIARSVHMSSAYISRVFKKETSFTIKWCLNNVRMQHAQQLLTETDVPIKDIGPAVGYTDMRGFYKMFAKHFGVTCTEMRKSLAAHLNG